MQYPELITEESVFVALREQCAAVFHIDRRLPDRVFRHGFARYYVFGYGRMMRNDFAEVLERLAQNARDEAVNYMTVEPDPVKYYYKHCGFYGLASFSAKTVKENYIKVMSRDGSVESFRGRGGDVGVLWGGSRKWGIMCDRITWETCVVGLDMQLDEAMKSDLGCIDTSTLTTYIANLYRNKETVAREFVAKLKENYPRLR
jgi:hypothetical protein